MKKLVLVLIPLLVLTGLYAVEFDISGENRARAAIYNDATEVDGGHIDNRFNIGFDSQFHQNLKFRVAAEIGDIIWGNGGGAVGTDAAFDIKELNFDFNIEAIDANIIVGQQYWNDRMSLVLDDYFSGIMLKKQFGDTIDTEFAWMKVREGTLTQKDDHDVVMAHARMNSDMPLGMYLFFGNYENVDASNLTLMPYLSMEMGPAVFDANVFMDIQMQNDDTETGFGAAVKAKIDMDILELGADLLLASENGLSTVSPWYQNGLYIYGIGKHHDGLNLYWNTPYQGNTDMFASIVGNVRAPVAEKIALFGALGYLTDIGMEFNAGMEYELIPDLLNMAAYGAYGIHDNETNNYILGTTMAIEF
ncbi:MAG: hypothetical protein PHO85_05560 [Candidatus Cloacimonetes bacterium]|nr:hypothetical protein [Candidatus Cloacimonadota bacterium]MDD2506498.1 hypothetical protein [Candidatus Cloacimonadota bacterium]MDD4147968.1 hypothetical protein [Candidatus Cloacimonadota bacterium]MDD4559864.1 hypothetical protein [Candidatus Cloacimonadota bacterium]